MSDNNNNTPKRKPVRFTPPSKRPKKQKTTYEPEFAEVAKLFWMAGMSDAAVARRLRVSPQVISKWKKKFPDFAYAKECAKEQSLAEIADAMRRKALDGDVKAAEFLLKKLAPEIYGDKKTIEVTGEIQVKDRSDAELLEIIERGKAIEAEVLQIQHDDIEDADYEEMDDEDE